MRIRDLFLLIVLPAVTVAATSAGDLPLRKAGLWEIIATDATATRRAKPVTVQQCTSAAVDQQVLLAVAPGQENCEPPEVDSGADGSYTVHTRCSVHGNAVQTRIEFSGDLQSAYEGHYEAQFAQVPDGRRDDGRRAQHFAARWIGACPADMQPGDVRLPIGVLVNVLSKSNHDE